MNIRTEAIANTVAQHPSESRFSVHVHYLRGLAAVAVVLFHLSAYLTVAGVGEAPLHALHVKLGVYGVAVFFAISGNLMAGLSRRMDASTFLSRRVIRIYPMYFVVTGLAWLAFAAFGLWLPISFSALILAPMGRVDYPLGVEWTLVFEISFYMILTAIVAIRCSAWIDAVAIAWLQVLVGLWIYSAGASSDLITVDLLPMSYASAGFFAGLLIPRLLRSGFNPWLFLPLALIAAAANDVTYPTLRMISGFGAAVIVACAADLSTRGHKLPMIMHRPLSLLGDSSYAMYLCHVPIIRLLFNFGKDSMPAPALWAAGLLLCVVVSLALGYLDIKLYKRLKAGLAAAPRRVVTIGCVIFALVYAGAVLSPGMGLLGF